MRGFAIAVTALVIALVAAVPATAQETGAGPHATFRLVVYGQPPEGEQFSLAGGIRYSDDITLGGSFCGEPTGDPGESEPCEGGGRVYALAETFYRNEAAGFRYNRLSADGGVETFVDAAQYAGTEDVVITAYYDYRTGHGGLGEGPGEPGLPDTGAGATAGTGVPRGLLAAGLFALGWRR